MQALPHEYSVNMSESLQSFGFWTLTKEIMEGNRLKFLLSTRHLWITLAVAPIEFYAQ